MIGLALLATLAACGGGQDGFQVTPGHAGDTRLRAYDIPPMDPNTLRCLGADVEFAVNSPLCLDLYSDQPAITRIAGSENFDLSLKVSEKLD